LYIVQNRSGQVNHLLKQYSQALAKDNYTAQEIQEVLLDISKVKPAQGWLVSD